MPRLIRFFPPVERELRASEGLRRLRIWRAWQLGRSRCPYCIGEPDMDWLSMCDCFYDEALKDRLWARIRQNQERNR